MAQGKLIELPDRPGAAFGGLEIGAIADGFQSADAFAVELLIAQRFVVAGAVANAQPAVTRKLGKVSEACRVLDIGDQEMRADQAHARRGAQALDLRERAAGLVHQPAELGLVGERLIQQFIEEQRLGTECVVRQFL